MEHDQVVISDDLPVEPSPKYKGFRKRWTSREHEPGDASASEVAPDDQSLVNSVRSWDFVDDVLNDGHPSDAAMFGHDANFLGDGFGDLDFSPSTAEETPDPHPRAR